MDNNVAQTVEQSKPNNKSLKVTIAALVALVILLVGSLFVLMISNNKQQTPLPNPTIEATNTPAVPTLSEEVTPMPTIKADSHLSLYLGEYDSKPMMFVPSNKNAEDPYLAAEYEATGSFQDSLRDIEENNIKAYKKLFSAENVLSVWPQGFVFNSEKDTIYFSVRTVGLESSDYEFNYYVYEFDLTTNQTKELYDYTKAKATVAADSYGGHLSIEKMFNDKYLILRLGVCRACDEVSDGVAIVFNIENERAKNLGEVGNFSIDSANNFINYNKVVLNTDMCTDTQTYCVGRYEFTGDEGRSELP